MQTLELKPAHKVVVCYYDNFATFAKLGIKHETALRSAPHSFFVVRTILNIFNFLELTRLNL
jgi:hypothetical protein